MKYWLNYQLLIGSENRIIEELKKNLSGFLNFTNNVLPILFLKTFFFFYHRLSESMGNKNRRIDETIFRWFYLSENHLFKTYSIFEYKIFIWIKFSFKLLILKYWLWIMSTNKILIISFNLKITSFSLITENRRKIDELTKQFSGDYIN